MTEFIFDVPERKNTHGSECKTHNFKRKKMHALLLLNVKKRTVLSIKNTHGFKRKKYARFEA